MMSILLALHIAAASLAAVAGAMLLAKGSAAHRAAGRWFVLCMVVMGIAAAPLAWRAGVYLDTFTGLMVAYLVLSSWASLNRVNRTRDRAITAFGACVGLGLVLVEVHSLSNGFTRPDVPPGAGFVFAAITALAVFGDGLRLGGRVATRPARLVRHLWRMCFAFFMATGSFFLARAHLFPEAIQQSGVLYVLALAPLGAMLAWWVALRVWPTVKVTAHRFKGFCVTVMEAKVGR